MKQIIIIITIISFSMNINAQEEEKQRELGVTFSNFENFGFTFKTGTSKSLWRINTIFANGKIEMSRHDEYYSKNKTTDLGFSFGKEYRNNITKSLEFRLGADLTYRYISRNRYYEIPENSEIQDIKSLKYIYHFPGINLVFGLNYIFNNKFVIGAEILPGISKRIYNYEIIGYDVNEENETYGSSNFVYGISNNSVLLSFAYRF